MRVSNGDNMKVVIYVDDPMTGHDRLEGTIPNDTNIQAMLTKIGTEGFTQDVKGSNTKVVFYPPRSILKVLVLSD
jgi:hypothetical protein